MLSIFPQLRIKPLEKQTGAIIPTPFQVISKFFEPVDSIGDEREPPCSHLRSHHTKNERNSKAACMPCGKVETNISSFGASHLKKGGSWYRIRPSRDSRPGATPRK